MSYRLLTLLCGLLLLPVTVTVADDTLRALDNEGSPGATVTITIEADIDDILRGFSFGLTHDEDVATVIDAVAGADLEGFNESDGPDYFFTDTDPDNGPGIVVGCIFALPPSDDEDSLELESGDEYQIVSVDYEISTSAETDDSTDLDFSSDLGETPVAIVFSGSAFGRTPELESGVLTVVEVTEEEFLRGDANTNGSVSALLDALAMMSFAFLPDSDDLLCMDAADVDDSGTFSALLDSLYLLNWQFNNGEDIADPGPSDCGPDATDDDALDCETPPDCS